MLQGKQLDSDLLSNCMGTRLHPLVGQADDHSANLFKKYHELYSKWRDDGITKARDLLVNEGRNVCIISLDLQEYYYRVQIDWQELRAQLVSRKAKRNQTKVGQHFFQKEILGEKLFDCIESIFAHYKQRIKPELSITHPDLPDSATCLPIGLCASPLIANWYLKEFDLEIMAKVRPAYFGRYVDDILMVVTSESVSQSDPVKNFIDEILATAGILQWQQGGDKYELKCKPGLFLQKKKCIVQYFDANHSIAGLEIPERN
jgi:hypothetical protein